MLPKAVTLSCHAINRHEITDWSFSRSYKNDEFDWRFDLMRGGIAQKPF